MPHTIYNQQYLEFKILNTVHKLLSDNKPNIVHTQMWGLLYRDILKDHKSNYVA